MPTPTLQELPPPPPGRRGWPWTDAGPQPPDSQGGGWPRISLVTPSLNQGGYIEETIRSVLLQGYPHLEYFIIDGGSTDETLAVIAKYEPWLTGWVSEPDRCQSQAINKGLRRATGELVGWLNSDDLLYPGGLWPLARAYREHPGAALVYGGGAKVDAGGAVAKDIPLRPYQARLLTTRCYILQPSALFARQALERAGLLDEDLRYAMDWDLWIRLGRAGEVVSIADKVGRLRVYPDTVTNSGGWRRKRELAEIGRRHNGFWDKNWLAFWPLYWLEGREESPPGPLAKFVGRLLRRGLDLAFGRDSYMIH